MPFQIRGNSVQDLERSGRIGEDSGSDGDRGRACKQEFDGILTGTDSTHSNDRDVDGTGGFIHHLHGDRFDGRTAQSAGDIGNFRTACFDVDRHCGNRVDHGDDVATVCGRGAGELRHALHVRAELGNQRETGCGAHGGDHFSHGGRIGTEGNPPLLDVRTGDIDFESGDSIGFRLHPFRDEPVILDTLPPDVDNHLAVMLLQPRQIMRIMQEAVDTGPLKADGVDHSAGDLRDPGSRISMHGLWRDAFHDHRAEDGGIEELLIFAPVPERSGCGHHRVGEFKRTELDGKIRLHNTPRRRSRPVLPCRYASSAIRRTRRDLSF